MKMKQKLLLAGMLLLAMAFEAVGRRTDGL